MNEKVLAFDVETWKIAPPNTKDIKALRPLGITCIGIAKRNGPARYQTSFYGDPPDPMTPEQCRNAADYLLSFHAAGWTVVAWNGLSFDFLILADECQDDDYRDALAALALNHVDPGFQMVWEKGFMAGLNSAAKGMGLPGKTEGMSGALAPDLWQNGTEEQRAKVIEYVVQDSVTTLDTYDEIVKQQRLDWTSTKGNPQTWQVDTLKTCREVMQTPRPGRLPSWAWDPVGFYGWTGFDPEEVFHGEKA